MNVSENIGLIVSGIDPATRKYVGRDAAIRARIARIRANKKMPDVDKKEMLTDLNGQLQMSLPAARYKANIALVARYPVRLTIETAATSEPAIDPIF